MEVGQTAALSRKEAIGASIASSAGSLPLHLMPLIVVMAIGDGALAVDSAGAISSAYWAGLSLSSLALPLIGARRIDRAWLALIAICTAAAVLACRGGTGYPLLATWAIVGIGCGFLNFIGTTSAAAYHDRHFVVGLRLGVVMLVAALILGASSAVGGFDSYRDVADVVAMAFVLVCATGLVWYRAPQFKLPRNPSGDAPRSRARLLFAFLLTALFFAGQPGFMAYSGHLAITHGNSGVGLFAFFAISKVVGALALWRWGANARSGAPTVGLGIALAVAILGMFLAQNLWIFAAGVILWELAINPQSARLQASVVNMNPADGGRWLPAAIGIGASLGPIIHGSLMHLGSEALFVCFCAISGLFPAALYWGAERKSPNLPQR